MKRVWYGLTIVLVPEHTGHEEDERQSGLFLSRWNNHRFSRVFDEDECHFEFDTVKERNECYRQSKKLPLLGVQRWKRVLEK